MNKNGKMPVQAPAMPMRSEFSRRKFLAVAASVPVVVAVGPALAGPTEDLLKEVKAARTDLKGLVAKFKQVRKIGLLANEVKSEGELTVVMPDKLRWELFAPDEIIYWVNGPRVAYKSKSSKKAAEAPAGAFGKVLPDLIAFLGGDLEPLAARYAFTATKEKDGAVTIVATPTADDIKSHLKRLTMRTNAERWGVSKVVIEEPKGDSSTIEFATNEKNPKIPPEKMKPPT